MASHFFFQLVVTDIFVHSSAEMGMFIKRIAGCPPNGDYWEYSFALWQGIINCLPSGSYRLTTYSQSVTSSIVGPVEEASRSGPLRATLPTEVVMVSTYVMPVTSSLTMQLVPTSLTFSHLSTLFWETSPCTDVTALLWGLLWKLTSIQLSIYHIFCLSW